MNDSKHTRMRRRRQLERLRIEVEHLRHACKNMREMLYRLSRNPNKWDGQTIRDSLVRWGVGGEILRDGVDHRPWCATTVFEDCNCQPGRGAAP